MAGFSAIFLLSVVVKWPLCELIYTLFF
ncbi:hypothetical protein EVA_21516, partial [gut metagenome]